MRIQKNKRRLYTLWAQKNNQYRLTAEDRAWLNMAPIGREFGSPDYELLTKYDELPDFTKLILLKQVLSNIGQRDELINFDAERWLAHWLKTPLPALGGN